MHNRAHRVWKQKMQPIHWRAFMAKEKQRDNHLEFEQVRTLLTSLPDYLVLAVDWSVAAGTRRTVTFSLEWANIFWERGYAIVREKGKPEFKVWLSPQLIDILHRAKALGHPAAKRQRRYSGEQDADRHVFCSRNWRKLWEAALAKAGIEDFRWHYLRHTFATWLRQEGAPLEVVQRAPGAQAHHDHHAIRACRRQRASADSDEVAHRFRFEAARDSDFISPIIPR
jgi:integrase